MGFTIGRHVESIYNQQRSYLLSDNELAILDIHKDCSRANNAQPENLQVTTSEQSFYLNLNLTGLAVSRSHLISRMFTRILIPVKPPDSASCPDDAKVQNGYCDPASEVAGCVDLLEYDQGQPGLHNLADCVHEADDDRSLFAVSSTNFLGPAAMEVSVCSACGLRIVLAYAKKSPPDAPPIPASAKHAHFQALGISQTARDMPNAMFRIWPGQYWRWRLDTITYSSKDDWRPSSAF
jgi:hypothetical protein